MTQNRPLLRIPRSRHLNVPVHHKRRKDFFHLFIRTFLCAFASSAPQLVHPCTAPVSLRQLIIINQTFLRSYLENTLLPFLRGASHAPLASSSHGPGNSIARAGKETGTINPPPPAYLIGGKPAEYPPSHRMQPLRLQTHVFAMLRPVWASHSVG